MLVIFRILAVVGFGTLAVGACSSKSSDSSKVIPVDDVDSGKSALGSGGAGGMGSGAGGGVVAETCAADAGSDLCRQCLTQHCCSAATACFNDKTCSGALDQQVACLAEPGADPSDCFSKFGRAVTADGGQQPQAYGCIILSCTGPCGGPQII